MRTFVIVSSLALVSCAFAGGGPRFTSAYGQRYAEVGDPGNADYRYQRSPNSPVRFIGGVDYRYRIAITEVTNAQWAEFANAIAPHLNGLGGYGSDFVPTIAIDGLDPQGNPRFSVVPGAEQFPARMGWRWAARYCNWLHNDKALSAEAFESGAYDTSTFRTEIGEFGFTEYTDQSTRSDGARFWIPSEDEWVKAAYYDPDRYGEDQGGYWRHHGMSDDPLVTAPPDQGGETNAAGYEWGGEGSGLVPFDSGSYPHAASHYGVLDTSGGQAEWTESWASALYERDRIVLGSDYFGTPKLLPLVEGIGLIGTGSPTGNPTGLRLAMTIPSPGSVTLLAFTSLLAARRRR